MPNSASAPTPNTMARPFTDIGSLLPCPWPFAAGAATAAAGLGGATAGSLGGGGGQVTVPSLMTVRPRMASSSMFTSMTPSLVLHSSSVRRSRLFPYRVEDCFARRLARSV